MQTTPRDSIPSHPEPTTRGRSLVYYVTFLWGVLGVLALFARALSRLVPMAWQPIADGSLSTLHIAAYAAWVVFNGYAEGYRAFQKSFCPRVIGRAHHLASNPKPLYALLAPLYCLSLFHANRRGLIVAWVMLAIITLLVWLLRITPQPWRGIVDGGVVVALAWGAMTLVLMAIRALMGAPPKAKLNLPGT
jgi:hypothetical protein